MVKHLLIIGVLLVSLTASAQEVLLPLERVSTTKRAVPKTSVQSLRLPFFDDFSTNDLSLWQIGGGASVSLNVSPWAPTVGVATLDAIGPDGRLYQQAGESLFPADTLCSLPIRLDSLMPADSVMLSFFYLPGGGYGNMWERVGDAPDAQDSLFVDFYVAADSSWENVWATGGVSVDSLLAQTGMAWQYVVIPLVAPSFFDSTFRFRFRNYASITSSTKAGVDGNCDYWHIDYVQLYSGRQRSEGFEERDVAFATPASSMLKAYRAMPYWQFQADNMAEQLNIAITNLYGSALATHYGYSVLDAQSNAVYQYDGGFENAPSHFPGGEYQSATAHAAPPVEYVFQSMATPTKYLVQHVVSEGTGADMHPANDTLLFEQIFDNYYAYDDGSAENGYGLTTTAAKLYLAYRFDIGQMDTLTALDIFFNETASGDNEKVSFYITIWADDGGKPGTVLYRDEYRRYPQAGSFCRYVLEQPVITAGTVYVGFEQTGNKYINIGFDRSTNTSGRIWYLTGTEWQRSILSGSLMLRLCLRAAATVGIVERKPVETAIIVFPNPAMDRVNIIGMEQGSTWYLYDDRGCIVRTGDESLLDVQALPAGLYLLRVVMQQGESIIHKLIIRH